jgi:hypothetical protein
MSPNGVDDESRVVLLGVRSVGEFFKSWRRKVGCVALVMALAAFGAWMRSHVKHDVVMLPSGNDIYCVESMWGQMEFGRVTPQKNRRAVASWNSTDISNANWNHLDENGNPEAVDYVSEMDLIEWRWAWGGFRFGAGSSPDYRTEDYQLPYWSLTFPLTILSAYLILWKPRPQQPESLPRISN